MALCRRRSMFKAGDVERDVGGLADVAVVGVVDHQVGEVLARHAVDHCCDTAIAADDQALDGRSVLEIDAAGGGRRREVGRQHSDLDGFHWAERGPGQPGLQGQAAIDEGAHHRAKAELGAARKLKAAANLIQLVEG